MSDEPFPGWDRPHYTQVPDNFFDEVMADLTLAETRVLLYIIRRTLGFQQDAASISIDQIMHGKRAADGTQLERGTELSKAPVQKALKVLLERGLIMAERHISKEFGSRPTTYSLPFLGGVSQQRPPRLSANARGYPGADALPIEEIQSGERQENRTEERETADPAALWTAALEQLRAEGMAVHTVNMLRDLPVSLDGGTLVVRCPRDLAAKWGGYVRRAAGVPVRFEG